MVNGDAPVFIDDSLAIAGPKDQSVALVVNCVDCGEGVDKARPYYLHNLLQQTIGVQD